jgi:hypothetical protein
MAETKKRTRKSSITDEQLADPKLLAKALIKNKLDRFAKTVKSFRVLGNEHLSRCVRDANGNVVNGPDGKPKMTTHPFALSEAQIDYLEQMTGDLLAAMLDGLRNPKAKPEREWKVPD